MRRLSTADVAPSQALDYYAASMQAEPVPMSVQCSSRAHFHAAAESTRFGQAELLRMVGSAHRVVRGRSELARSERRLFNLLINRLAPWQLVQRGLNHLRAADAIIIDSAYAHEFDVGTYEFINVAMTEEFMALWLADPTVLTARRLDKAGRWTAPLASFVSQLTAEFTAGRCTLPEGVMANQLGALLMLAASDISPGDHGLLPSELGLHDRIIECLRERLSDVALTSTEIADSLSIEERTLHRVLAANGETFATQLLGLRLREADGVEATPSGNKLSADAMARSVGFLDARRLASARRNRARVR